MARADSRPSKQQLDRDSDACFSHEALKLYQHATTSIPTEPRAIEKRK
jgi:hypothetical protein